ncbi:MAG: hypothetical protein U0840_09180 [Gemmataceae bacterium]
MSRWMMQLTGTAFLVALMALVGCGSGGSAKGDKIIVKGKVTLDGKDAEGVSLSFYGPSDKAASGNVTTQADGTYEVMFVSQAGEGNYQVSASKGGNVPGITKGEGIDDFQMKLASGAKSGNNPGGLPARYADPSSSGLTVPLVKGMNEGKNFALKTR